VFGIGTAFPFTVVAGARDLLSEMARKGRHRSA
jgi:hypothetical protein